MTATLYCGDVRTVLATLPERSVQTVCTSPPYYSLRDYGHAGQIGLEESPDAYVQTMVDVFRAVRRVMRDDATLWLNLGDSYGAAGGDIFSGFNARWSGTGLDGGKQAATGRNASSITQRETGLRPKNLLGIPWRVAFALQADGWYLRSEIIWAKPNPMPESVTDRPTKAHEQVFLLSKSPTYYYDAAAIAEAPAESTVRIHSSPGVTRGVRVGKSELNGDRNDGDSASLGNGVVPTTRNARSVWSIATQPYAGSHFATMPQELARRCILAGSSAKSCRECGAPWDRTMEATNDARPSCRCRLPNTIDAVPYSPVPSVVLDPFGGSGTTAAVAVGHGRRAIHIDLNPAYIQLARERIGPMLCTGAA